MYRQMRYFIAVVEANSFFEAGEACHISQSAVSQQIKALEAELQAQLLERHGRSFTVTPAGQYFYEQAKRQTAALDALVREVRRIDRGEFQRLRVGILNGFSPRVVRQTIRRFTQAHPNVRLSLTTGTHEELFLGISGGTLDMAVNDQWRALSEQYVNEPLQTQPLFALLRGDDPLAAAGSAPVESLRDALCVLVSPPEQRESEANHWRAVMGVQSSFFFAPTQEAARMNAAAGIGFHPCDGDAPPEDGAALLPLTRGGIQLTRRMYAFWPDSGDSSLQWEFVQALREGLGNRDQGI